MAAVLQQLNLALKTTTEILALISLSVTYGVYIGHKICHRVLATSATLLSRPDITMSEEPKDQKGPCPASKQVISMSNGFKITSFVFLQLQRQSNVKYWRKQDFAVLQRQQMDYMFTTSYN